MSCVQICSYEALYDKILDMNSKEKISTQNWLASGGENRQSGFLEIIIIIIIALLIMKYFGITISGMINWFTMFFRDVLK